MPSQSHAGGQASEPLRITDTAVLRAIAHPARQLMLARLQIDGPATATECSELVGLSPSACSWHLRALARAGLVVRVDSPDGRHTRWAAVARGTSYGTRYSADPAYRVAARELASVHLQQLLAIQQAWAAREAIEDPSWVAAAEHSDDLLWLTADELVALSEEVLATLRAYRRLEPAHRPPGARQVLFAFQAVPFELGWLAQALRAERGEP